MEPLTLNLLVLAVFIVLSTDAGRNQLRASFRAEDGPAPLAVFRCVTFGYVAATLVGMLPGNEIWTAVRFARLPEELRIPVQGWRPVYEHVPFDFDPPLLVLGIGVALLLSSTAAAIGYRVRITGAITTALLLYYLVVFHSYGKVNHNHHLIWFAFLLTVSPSGDALGVDAWRRGDLLPRTRDRAYAIPIRITWLLLGAIYLFPGLSKLSESGLRWALSDNLLYTLYAKWFTLGPGAPRFDLSGFGVLLQAAALGVIIFEIGFVFAVFHRRSRPVAALAGVLFHFGTWLFMRIGFESLIIAYTTFLPWQAWFERLNYLRPVADVGSRTEPTRRTRLVGAAGVALVLGAYAAGFAGKLNGWPFALYPKFSALHGPQVRALVVEVDGESVYVDDVVPWMSPERSTGLMRSVIRSPGRKLDAFRELIGDPEANVEFYVETYRLGPFTERGDEPLRRRRLDS